MRTYKRKNALNECSEPIEGVLGLCRLCLEEAKESVPIFANKNDVCTALATRIMMCVGYEITREDCLPNTICTECHNKLNKYYEFRKKCDTTYHKLKNHLLAVRARTTKKLNIEQEEQNTIGQLLDSTSVGSISQSICPINQSITPISQSVCPINRSVCPISQSVYTVTHSVGAASQSVSAVTQTDSTVNPLDGTVSHLDRAFGQLDSTVGQSICIVSQPDCAVSQSDTSIDSHLVTMSRDELILAFEKPLEIVQTELQQNGLDSTINGWMDGAVNNKCVQDIPLEANQSNPLEVCTDVSEFLSSILIEMGVLKRQQSELRMTDECRTIQMETGDFEQITLELVQIEEEQLKTTTTNTRKKVTEKAINEVNKRLKDERPRCTECGRDFSSRAVLKRHWRTHTGERPFRCASCGLSFTQREVLTRHALVHQEVRPFACARCPKSFTQRGALEAHARRHAPAAPATLHHCAHCPKRFLHASGLSRHTKSHQGRVWACAACGKHFSDDSALRRHRRAKHEPAQPPQEI